MHSEHHALTGARELDRRIRDVRAVMAHAQRDLALLLAEMADKRHFLDLGYASVGQYAEVKLQLEPRKTRGLVRIRRALPELPRLDQALASGELCWTKARELLSVITPEVEAEWVQLASQSTSRELERTVAAHRPGERPSDEANRESGPVRVSFSMEPVEAEQVRALLAALRAKAGVSREETGDGALLAQVAARVLDELDSAEAPTGERFRIVIEHCPSCGRTAAPEAEVSETHVGQACCDAEILEMREGPTRGHVTRTIPPATRRAVLQRDHHRCQVPGCSNRLWLDIHHLEYFRNGGDHSEQNLLTLCSTHHQLVHDGLLGIERGEGGGSTGSGTGGWYGRLMWAPDSTRNHDPILLLEELIGQPRVVQPTVHHGRNCLRGHIGAPHRERAREGLAYRSPPNTRYSNSPKM
jgi:5-methylcytosine-specific restriction endonuclease McrA